MEQGVGGGDPILGVLWEGDCETISGCAANISVFDW